MNIENECSIVKSLERIAAALESIDSKLPEKEVSEKHNNDRPSERFYGCHNCQWD